MPNTLTKAKSPGARSSSASSKPYCHGPSCWRRSNRITLQVKRERKPFPLNAILHVHVAPIVYNYSDPGMEDALYEIESLRRFCGIRLEAVPDESTGTCWKRTG